MDTATLVGLLLGFVGVFGGNMMEGGSISALINIPGFMIVVLGSIGAGIANYPLEMAKRLPKILGKVFKKQVVDTTIVPAPISIPFGTQIAAKASTTVGLTGNVDANHSIGQAFSTTATMIDSLGVEHPVKIALTKKASNQWTVTTSANARATLQDGGTGSVDTVTGTPTQEIRPGTWGITSDAGGNLTAIFTPTGGSAEPTVVGTITASGTNTTLIPGLTLTNGGGCCKWAPTRSTLPAARTSTFHLPGSTWRRTRRSR